MSRLSRDRASLVDHARTMLLSGFANGVSDPSALTATDLTLAYTTDDPVYTPDGAFTIADGDSLTAANQTSILEEMERTAELINDDLAALRTAVVNLIGDNVFDVSAPAALTSSPVSTAASTEIVDLTITTDNPAITPDGTVTIADGDLTTAVELLQYFIEWNAMARKLYNDMGAIHAHVSRLIGQKSFDGLSALPALTVSAGFLTVTYTTDNPSITPDGTITIADGDNISVANRNEIIAEIEAIMAAQVVDLTAIRTAYANFLAAADIA